MKKALKTVLSAVLIMLLCVCTVSAAAEEADAHADLLSALGIINSEDRYREEITTRAELVCYALRLTGNGILSDATAPEFTDVSKSHWAYSELSSAYALGLICAKSQGKFYPDSPIEYADAARILLCAVGYTDYVKNMSDTNVIRLADSVKLLKNVSKPVGMPMEREDIIELLYNAMSIDMPFLQSIAADGTPQYYLEKGKNILSERFNVYCSEGVVTADDNAAVTGKTAGKGGIAIDGTVYDGTLDNAEDYIGCNVVCYWYDYDFSREIVTVYERKNTIYEFAAEDAEYTGTAFCEITDGKRTSRRINATTTVLINGCVVRDKAQINESLSSYLGTIKMIDNNRDGVYDIVIIKRYQNLRVASYNDVDLIISGQNGERVDLDRYEEVAVKDCYWDESDLSRLAVDMIVSVYLPTEADKRAVLVTGGAEFTAELMSLDYQDDKHIVMVCDDDNAYTVSRLALFDGEELIMGEDYSCYPDWRGEIAFAELGTENMTVGFIKRAVLTEDEQVQLSIFGSDGTNRIYTLKDSVALRAEDGTTTRMEDAEAYRRLYSKRQPVMYKLTNNDMISKLWLAAEDRSLIFHVLDDDVNKNSYRLEYRNGNFMGKYITTAQTCYMIVPKNGNNAEDYKIGTSGIFSNGSYVYFDSERTSARMYAIEPDSFITDLMVYAIDYTSAKSVKEAIEPVMYFKKTLAANEDNEGVCNISVIGSDGREKTYQLSDCGEEAYDMNGRKLNYGDIIRLAEDERGKITAKTIQTMYDSAADKHMVYLGSTTVRYLAVTRVIPAEVLARNGNYIQFKTYAGYEPGGSGYKESTEIAQIGTAAVYVYDRARNELVQSSPARVSEGDKLVLYESYGVAKMLIYYK